MEITQRVYVKTEPPKDRPILARLKPTSWQLMDRAIAKSDDDLIDWSEA